MPVTTTALARPVYPKTKRRFKKKTKQQAAILKAVKRVTRYNVDYKKVTMLTANAVHTITPTTWTNCNDSTWGFIDISPVIAKGDAQYEREGSKVFLRNMQFRLILHRSDTNDSENNKEQLVTRFLIVETADDDTLTQDSLFVTDEVVAANTTGNIMQFPKNKGTNYKKVLMDRSFILASGNGANETTRQIHTLDFYRKLGKVAYFNKDTNNDNRPVRPRFWLCHRAVISSNNTVGTAAAQFVYIRTFGYNDSV